MADQNLTSMREHDSFVSFQLMESAVIEVPFVASMHLRSESLSPRKTLSTRISS